MKVTVVGAGNVGATTVKVLADSDLVREIVLTDIVEGIPQGKALDIAQSISAYGKDTRIIGTNGYEETAGSDIVVITAGFPRKPGMTRDDLLNKNAEVVGGVVKQIAHFSPKCIIICVTNPLDVMAYLAFKVSGFPRERVIGMAGVLDTSRFKLFLAEELGVSASDIQAMVLGGHGDTMVPLIDHTTVDGVSVRKLIDKERLEKIVQRARDGGGEIVNYLKTGSAFYAPATSVLLMIEAIVKDKHMVLPVAALCQGEYGIKDTYVGVPAHLGRGGLEKIVETELSAEELAALKKSAAAVREQIDVLKL
jgi:malate dehydrogenase